MTNASAPSPCAGQDPGCAPPRAGLGQKAAGWFSSLVPEPGAPRRLGAATALNNIGNGMFLTSSVLYFTRGLHLPVAEVGIGLTVAGLVGLLAGVPIGDLADRRGPRGVVVFSLLVLAVTMAGYVFVTHFWMFVVVAVADMLATSASRAARGGLIRRVGGEGAATYRAQLRAIGNAGIGAGALVAGLAVQLDTRAGYQALILVNALTFLLSALVCATLPHFAPLPVPAHERRWVGLHDRSFVSYTVLNGVMSLQYAVLIFALPLWIASRTHAPRWMIGGVMLINTIECLVLQVRVGRTVRTVRQGAAAMRVAGFVFLASSVIIALAGDLPTWPAAGLLVIAVMVHTLGEMWHASATFALGFELAPDYAQSQYLGLQDMGLGAGLAVAPIVLTALCLELGQVGWVLLGGVFVVAGLATVPVAGWAERTRPVSIPVAPRATEVAR